MTVTEEQLEAWLERKLQDPEWVAKIRRRSEEANALIRTLGAASIEREEGA